MTTLEKLYYGNLCPADTEEDDKSETKIKTDLLYQKREILTKTGLSEEQKTLLEEYEDMYIELITLYEKNMFLKGFRLGAKLTLETFER